MPLFVVGGLVPRRLANALFGAYGTVLADNADNHLKLLERARALSHAERASFLLLKILESPDPAAAPGMV